MWWVVHFIFFKVSFEKHPNVHRWKAVEWISAFQVGNYIRMVKINFEPAGRHNFPNAFGQNCIHDLRPLLINSTIKNNGLF